MAYTTCDISVVIVVKFMRCASAAGAYFCHSESWSFLPHYNKLATEEEK